jgi:RNA polymerase sigma factor for flagellar operon FliA
MIAYSELKGSYQTDDQLVTENFDLVKRIAYHLAARLPSHFEIEDLMQAGMIGLLEAAGKFDESRGASFATYAGIRIRGAMLDEVRKRDWTPRSVYQKHGEVLDVMRELEIETGEPAEPDAIAARLGISLEEYFAILQDANACQLFSLDEILDESSAWHCDPSDSVAGMPEQALDLSQKRGAIAKAIERLPERERLVLSLYYEKELNLKEIGAILGIGESRVSQIHGHAVMRVRTLVERR